MSTHEELRELGLVDEQGSLKIEARKTMETPLQALADLLNDKVSSDSGVYVSECFQSVMIREERPYRVVKGLHDIPTLVFSGTVYPLDRLTCYPDIHDTNYQDVSLYKPVKEEHVDQIIFMVQYLYDLNNRNNNLYMQFKRYQCGKVTYEEIMNSLKSNMEFWSVPNYVESLVEEYYVNPHLFDVKTPVEQLIEQVELIESRRKRVKERDDESTHD